MPVLYSLITSIATIIGGLLPKAPGFRKLDFRYLVGFAAGAMISIAFFDIFHEIIELGEAAQQAIIWIAIGFFLVYLVEKFLLLHTCNEKECEQHSLGWPALIGIAAESLVDGIAIAIGYSVNPTLGVTIMLAVLAHEIPRGFTTTIIMKNAGKGNRGIWIALAIDAGFTPIGALIGTQMPNSYFLAALGFVAGAFLYIGAADLLPEAHKKFNAKVIWSVLLGVLVIYLVTEYSHIG